MDLNELDVSTAAAEGRPMDVINAKGAVVRKPDGTPLTVTLLGRFSDPVQDFSSKTTNKRLDAARRGADRLTEEELKAEATDKLVLATKAWDFTMLDGADFPCNHANARKLWTDVRFGNLREKALVFINDDGNFMKG